MAQQAATLDKQIDIKTAKDVFGTLGGYPIPIFDYNSPDNLPVVEDHDFDDDMIILGIAWMFANGGRNLFLTGPTGSGKSSFIEQFNGRIGMPTYVVACHGKLELQDLIGSWHLTKDGKMWRDGPAVRAMREGATLLLDEVNFLDPSVVGGLNRILDGMPYYIPETGETVRPHAQFRVAMTSNPFDPKYKGVKKMNAALLDRCLAATVDYLVPQKEAQVMNRAIANLSSWLIEATVSIANTVRVQFKEGTSETTVSTRGLIRWGRMIMLYERSLTDAVKTKDKAKLSEIMKKTLGAAVTNRSNPAEKSAIDQYIDAEVSKLTI